MTHIGTIVMSYSARLINEHSDYRVTFRAGDFRMDQFNAVVDGCLLGKFLNPLCNRPLIHDFNLRLVRTACGSGRSILPNHESRF